ncbi:Na+/H+ antiporter NhaC [candidate division KSB1 bacterium]|nr:Na+/H+ antiporter NhaC [candidate division KSB1 bacterium]RQW03248.1 MAG: Na+/H+ antiporter NhaC [candidate division KSB1 bacterium]
MTTSKPRQPALWHALLPVVFLIFFLGITILRFHGTPHIPLIGGSVVASIMGLYLGHSWKAIENGIVNGITIALQACLILLIIGVLIGTWIISGIVPTMIYYGLKLLAPSVFLVASCLICALVSLATGSSWSTAGTVGIALIGVGQGLGIPTPVVAGAIVSGSYFGDKLSPLSDTTNLAPAVAGAELFSHIRHMIYTTGPSFLISLLLYGLLGLRYSRSDLQQQGIHHILSTIEIHYNINPVLLLPALLVIAMVIFRIPALPALLGGAVLGGLFAILFQNAALSAVIHAAQTGYVSATGVAAVDTLLSRGGMESMLSTVALIMCALAFGGVMEKTGMLAAIGGAILKMAKGTGSLVASTVLTAIGMNIIAPDQYLAIVVPGRMYREAYQRAHLQAKNLSRALEDGGTLSSPLIPWNTCGSYMWATLGVYPLAYLPFAFLNVLNPIISIVLGYTGWTIAKEK